MAVSRVPFSIGSRFVWGWRTFGGSDEDDGALGRALRPGRGERLRGVCARDAGGQTHRRGDSGTERHGLHCCSFNCDEGMKVQIELGGTFLGCHLGFLLGFFLTVVSHSSRLLSYATTVGPAGRVDPNSVSTFGFIFGDVSLESIDRWPV